MATTQPATVRRDTQLEGRILKAFSARARRNGPRGVVMADLARELQISTKTLYRLFPTKADLVQQLMERWAGRFDRDLENGATASDQLPFVEQLLTTSEVWQASRRRFGNRFWDELERDYPESYALLVDARLRLRQQILERLGPHMAPGLVPELAMELFDAALARALEPEVQRRLGVDSRAAIRHAVRIWAGGCLVHPLPRREPRRPNSSEV